MPHLDLSRQSCVDTKQQVSAERPFCGNVGIVSGFPLDPSEMPILKWFPPEGQPRTFVLHKPVTTVGRGLGNDVAIPNSTHGLAETHAQVLFDGRDFNLEEVDKLAEILINGKKKRRATEVLWCNF